MNPEEIVDWMMERDAFSQWLGIEVQSISEGYAKLQMTVRPEMVNGFGVCHGGIPFSFADSAFAFASNTRGKISVSIDNSIQYSAPIKAGDVLTAEAKESSYSNRVGFYEVTIHNQQDELVCKFQGTVYRTSKVHGE